MRTPLEISWESFCLVDWIEILLSDIFTPATWTLDSVRVPEMYVKAVCVFD